MSGKQKLLDLLLSKPKEDMFIKTTDTGDKGLGDIIDYMGAHALLPKGYDNIPSEAIKEMGDALLAGMTNEIEIKTVVMILAHTRHQNAVSILTSYLSKSTRQMKQFIKYAIEECMIWNEKRKRR